MAATVVPPHVPAVPHPDDAFVLGSSLGFRHDILQTFVNGWREVGDVSWYRTPRPMYVLAHPDHVRHILHEHHEAHPRSGYVRGMLKNIMGEGLFTCDERLWRYQVGLVAPPFETERCTGWAGLMVDEATNLVARLETHADERDAIAVLPELARYAVDVMGRILFGAEDWSRLGPTMREALIESWEWAIPRVTGFPTPAERLTRAYRRYRTAIRTRDWVIRNAIESRRDQPTSDLISTYVQAREVGSGAKPDDDRVLDAVTSALFGAFKGIPTTLAWTLYSLSHHPDVRTRLEGEIDAVVGGRQPALQDVEHLEYTRQVVDEVLRLYPPLWLMSRPPEQDEVIGGYHVPERVYLLAVPYITHRHPDFWDDPEMFDPERFAPGRAERRHPFAYLPFGLAHRKCIGEDYSRLQLPLALATLVQRLRFDVVAGYEPGRTTTFLLRPQAGLPMRITLRVSAPT